MLQNIRIRPPSAATALLWALLWTFDVSGQMLFKYGSKVLEDLDFSLLWVRAVVSSPWIFGGIGCYVGSFATWMLILRRTNLSLAFPLTAACYPLILLLSSLIFDDHISLTRWVGLALIMVGIALLGPDQQE